MIISLCSYEPGIYGIMLWRDLCFLRAHSFLCMELLIQLMALMIYLWNWLLWRPHPVMLSIFFDCSVGIYICKKPLELQGIKIRSHHLPFRFSVSRFYLLMSVGLLSIVASPIKCYFLCCCSLNRNLCTSGVSSLCHCLSDHRCVFNLLGSWYRCFSGVA